MVSVFGGNNNYLLLIFIRTFNFSLLFVVTNFSLPICIRALMNIYFSKAYLISFSYYYSFYSLIIYFSNYSFSYYKVYLISSFCLFSSVSVIEYYQKKNC